MSGLDVDQMLELRREIDEKLPVKSLADLDLNQELVLQMLTTQKLQRDVLLDDDIPANQRAQVTNAVSGILAQLVRLQTEVYSSERFKRIEQVLVESVREGLPEQVVRDFFERYERAARAKGL